MTLLRLLFNISRHALILTEINRAAVHWLTKLQPTLLLNQPQMSPRLRALCSASSNYRGVVLPEPKSGVLNFAVSKTVFIGNSAGHIDRPGHPYLSAARADGSPPVGYRCSTQAQATFPTVVLVT